MIPNNMIRASMVNWYCTCCRALADMKIARQDSSLIYWEDNNDLWCALLMVSW